MADIATFVENMRREVTGMQDSMLMLQGLLRFYNLRGWQQLDFEPFFPEGLDISITDFMAAIALCSSLQVTFEEEAAVLVKMRMLTKDEFVAQFRRAVTQMSDFWGRTGVLVNFFQAIGWDEVKLDTSLFNHPDLSANDLLAVIATFGTLQATLGSDAATLAKMRP